MTDPVFAALRRLYYFNPLRHISLVHRTFFEEDRVYSAEPSLLNYLIGFGIAQRSVLINGTHGFIMITRKTWFLSSLPKVISFDDIEKFQIEYDNLMDSWIMASEIECYSLQAKLLNGEFVQVLQWTGNFHHPETELVEEVKARDTSLPRTEANVAYAICTTLLEGFRKSQSELYS
ncbi:MAG: hypothetical protein ACFCU1_12865 [Sumerlaeia bacterium]